MPAAVKAERRGNTHVIFPTCWEPHAFLLLAVLSKRGSQAIKKELNTGKASICLLALFFKHICSVISWLATRTVVVCVCVCVCVCPHHGRSPLLTPSTCCAPLSLAFVAQKVRNTVPWMRPREGRKLKQKCFLSEVT